MWLRSDIENKQSSSMHALKARTMSMVSARLTFKLLIALGTNTIWYQVSILKNVLRHQWFVKHTLCHVDKLLLTI